MQAVRVDVSCAKERAGILSLFTSEVNLIKNSAAKCCASAADPPLPHRSNLPPPAIESAIISPASEELRKHYLQLSAA